MARADREGVRVAKATQTPSYRFEADLLELLSEIKPDTIVSRTVHKDEHVKVTLFGFAAGQELSEHTASKAAIIEILAGEGRLGLGDQVMDAKAGSWAYMTPGLRHSVTAESEVVMLLTLLNRSGA